MRMSRKSLGLTVAACAVAVATLSGATGLANAAGPPGDGETFVTAYKNANYRGGSSAAAVQPIMVRPTQGFNFDFNAIGVSSVRNGTDIDFCLFEKVNRGGKKLRINGHTSIPNLRDKAFPGGGNWDNKVKNVGLCTA